MFFYCAQSFAIKIIINQQKYYLGHQITKTENDKKYLSIIFKGKTITTIAPFFDNLGKWVITIDYKGNAHARFFGLQQNYCLEPINFTHEPETYFKQYSEKSEHLYLHLKLIEFLNNKIDEDSRFDELTSTNANMCAALKQQGWSQRLFDQHNICLGAKKPVQFYLGDDSDEEYDEDLSVSYCEKTWKWCNLL